MKQLSLFLFLMFGTIVLAQTTPQSFTLQEAIDYSLKNNRQAKNAARNIDAAKHQKWETITNGLPRITGKISYLNNLKQQFPGIDFNDDGIVDIGPKQSITPSATLTQLVFDGSYIVALQSAKVFLDISNNAKIKTDLQVKQNVINAYGNVLLSEESIKILNRNIKVLDQNLVETTKIYENGLGEEESVEQLQITLSNIKSSLNKTKRLKEVAYQFLNITLGLEVNAPTKLTDTLESLSNQNMSLALLENDSNIENNIDYKIAKNNTAAKSLLVKLERSKLLPTLSGFLTGSYIGNNDEFEFLNSDQTWASTAAFGFNLNIPIFGSGLQNARIQRAKINLKNAEDDLTETEQQLKLQIATAQTNYQFAIEDYNNKKRSLNLAERIQKKNQTKFFEGVGSSFELRQAQTQLYSIQQAYLQSMLNVINTKTALDTIINPTTNF